MKKTFLFIALISIASFAFGQREVKNGVVIDKQAETIISNVGSKLKTETPISLNFSLNKKGNKSSDKGTLTLNGNKYIASFSDNKVYCDGKTVWVYQKGTNEVNVNNIAETENEVLNISKFISEANTKFRPKLIREENGNYIIDLSPKTKSEFSKVRLKINKQTSRIASMEVNYKGGNVYSYTISNYKTKIKIKDSSFTFSKKDYPTASIVDLR
ncbi:MAG: outer membrane lipoprotein carrier protein LolA [Bacteroidales bacterium]|jgi:outer membrane lipoprotein-sorting protein